MKKYLTIALAALLMAACQPKNFREIYPEGNPVIQATMLTDSVLFGSDSVTFRVTVDEKETPLSQLQVKVMVGLRVLASEMIRTKDYHYEGEHTYAVPFGPNMPEGEEVKIYLTATNIEGTAANFILGGCYGKRPPMPTMYVMPPSVQYGLIGKGKQMTWDEELGEFVAYNLKYPKSIQCVLAVVGTRFGRIDWNYPVFGVVNSTLQLITKEQFEAEEASPIILEDDNFETLDTIRFNPVTFEIYIGGKIAMPVSAVNVETDLVENPSYMSASAAKQYLGGKIFFDKDSEVEITGVTDLSKAYNLDWMEYLGGNKVKFLGEKGMYYLSYKVAEDYLVVEPLYDLTEPDVMYLCGVGMGQPSWSPNATSGWGFDSPNQNFVGRLVAPKTYQFTVYMLNDAENADHPGFGSVNFKFFHQHGWGGEETSLDYTQSGLNIVSSTEDSNVGNWWSSSSPLFEGIYRITLDKNNMETRYEKLR
ncbi:MAG: DUF5016 domain-containing protein [Paludibacteraceae bacterium]|nr:DUF5016 domain-containing protein [Paludibacteraceae bacterium]